MTTYNGEAPIQNYFRLGGMFTLPGYSENELAGQNAVLFKAGYLRAIKPLLSIPTYLGATLQYGDVFQDNVWYRALRHASGCRCVSGTTECHWAALHWLRVG